MKNMTNKQKELLLKVLLVLGCIFLVLTGIFAEVSNSYIQEKNNSNLFEMLCLISLCIAFLLAIVITCFMGKVKIMYKGIKSKRLTLNTNKYEEFEKVFLEELSQNGYEEYKEIPNELNCEIKYLIHKSMTINDIVLIVRSKEKELSELAYQNYFEHSLNYIIEQEPYLSDKNTNLIHIVCVDRVNESLRKITESNIEQGYGRFNLPVGISLGSRTVYIATQKGGLFIARYKKLVKMFKSYVKNQIVE